MGCGGDDDVVDTGPDAADAGNDAADTGDDAGEDTSVDADDACMDRCTEVECAGTPSCPESSLEQCSDGIDNDGDGFADCRDFDCNSGPLVDFCMDENTEAACTDGLDNDGDERTDCDDGECVAFCDLTPVRVVAANLTTGARQNYNGGEGLRILDALQGDILLVQELLYFDNTNAQLRDWTDEACGEECELVREPPTLLPNAIVSRYPIVDSGVWPDPETDTRSFVWARIDVPGGIDVFAVSVHWLTSGGRDRAREALALVEQIEREVPGDVHLIIGGDFNTFSGDAFDTLESVVDTSSRPVDTMGDPDTNAPRERRLDGVLASRDLHGRETPVLIGESSFPDGLVVDTREYTPIEELAPALMSDSAAMGMQHMAVVRDFAL